ncbi:hypothetical protein ElyMa_002698100 [Elysia marginata]|uniref:Uncharacterized protein n=1 Tax=Elysia marginata TaxID=1093978 RepID=A0AAV4HEZ1_9GAST|nr:hypothetical protein ElyMa_002698100 [Elysia marginata]
MAASPSYKYRIFNKRQSGNRLNHSFDVGESTHYSSDYDYHGTKGAGISNGLGPKSLDRSFDTTHAYKPRESLSPTRRVVDRSFDASSFHNYSSSNGTRKVDRSFDASYYLNNNTTNLPSFSFSAVPPSSSSTSSAKFHNQSFDVTSGGAANGGRTPKHDRLNRSFDGRSFEHSNNIYSTTNRSSRLQQQQQQQPQSPSRTWTTSRSGEILDRSPDRKETLDRSFRAFNQAFNGVGEDLEEPLSLPVTNGFSTSSDLRGRNPTRSAMRSSDRTFEKRAHEETYVRRTGVSLDRGSSVGNLNRSFTAPGVSWKAQFTADDEDLWPKERPISFRSMVRFRSDAYSSFIRRCRFCYWKDMSWKFFQTLQRASFNQSLSGDMVRVYVQRVLQSLHGYQML